MANCPEFVRWTPEQCLNRFCPCPYPLCKFSSDEHCDFILDLMDEYVECVEALSEEGKGIENEFEKH